MEHAVAAGAANALVAEASSAAEQSKVKKITAVFWSFGEEETPVAGISRYFVDLNLHVETENYLKLKLRGRIGPDGKAKLMNVFAGKTLITLAPVKGE